MKKITIIQIVLAIIAFLTLAFLVFASSPEGMEFLSKDALKQKLNEFVFRKSDKNPEGLANLKYDEIPADQKKQYESLTKEQLIALNVKKDDQIEKEKLLKKEIEMVKLQNTQYAQMLNLKKKYSGYFGVTANVVSKNLTSSEKTSTIDAGSDQGIKENMTVLYAKGLYGKIISVDKNSSKVQLITDPVSKISAKIANTKELCLVQGSLENDLILTMLPQGVPVIAGQDVYTAGIGSVYPKDIYIGSIKNIIYTSNEAQSYAILDGKDQIENADQVLVISK